MTYIKTDKPHYPDTGMIRIHMPNSVHAITVKMDEIVDVYVSGRSLDVRRSPENEALLLTTTKRK